ncbi:hypothetical protein QC762_118425 [Podospora pseudocomata]|uniref:Uncharacterized protein n=4 Tax=Podospora TaxID=5144 RepID=A0ABR0I283_9PEZI|nr:hypothetical protein QC761_118425 [Podospora bellae-mahoneyi]KAK4660380.1 hypothetical protein QC762_118425 [Podospora pseudocomata]KAK4674212.1 hypothetical protein QC763_118425 [Podospora pseudopauciseta]KAK4682706.1 hypothetical protein QC764_118425 [Podospora pseudoanserina]
MASYCWGCRAQEKNWQLRDPMKAITTSTTAAAVSPCTRTLIRRQPCCKADLYSCGSLHRILSDWNMDSSSQS